MGKRSQQRMTGLTFEQRTQRPIKRRQKEEEMRRKEAMELANAMRENSALPSAPTPPFLPGSPIIRELLEIGRLRKQEERKKKP